MKFPGTQAFVNQFVVCTLVTLTGGGSVGVGAVWMQQRITMTAAANKALERDLAALQRRFDAQNVEIERETSVSVLEQRNLEWRLDLEQAPRDKVTRVMGDARLMLAAKRDLPTGLAKFAVDGRFSRPEDR